jgi:hypothetical protein
MDKIVNHFDMVFAHLWQPVGGTPSGGLPKDVTGRLFHLLWPGRRKRIFSASGLLGLPGLTYIFATRTLC